MTDSSRPSARPSAGRLVFTIAMTPLVPPLMLASVGYVEEAFPGGAVGLLGLIGIFVTFALPIAVPAVLVILIAYLTLRRGGWDRWWLLGLAGALIGWLYVFLLAWIFEDLPSPSLEALLSKAISKDALLMTASGGIAGCAFWYLTHSTPAKLATAAVVLVAGLALLAGTGALLAQP